MPKALAAAWVAAMGLYMLVRRDQIARDLAEAEARGLRRDKKHTSRRRHRALVIVVAVVGALFLVVGGFGVATSL